jgi:hypothetical protein
MFNDAIDDQPHHQLCAGFEGVDMTTPPALLPPGLLSDGRNIICDGDGLAKNRPGLRLIDFVSGTTVDGGSSYFQKPRITSLGYYDLPDGEFLMVGHDTKLLSLPSVENNISATGIFVPGAFTNPAFEIVQMLDTIYYLQGGWLFWAKNTAGTWTNGYVFTFSDGSAMPSWGRIISHNFRLLLMEAEGYKLYTSAVAAAALPANWVKTENIKVGTGTGDPARGLVASQGGFITMLNAQSVYQIDMTAAAVANWSSLRVTAATGCVQGRTAVAFGQDIYFLARQGVVNLGSLTDTISISPSSTLSAPIQPIIDRINWSNIGNAFATSWREFYLLAVALDSDTYPKHILAFHTRLKRWMPLWEFTSIHTQTQPAGAATTWLGFTAACVVNFGDKAETVLGDNCGRVLRLDATYHRDEFFNGTPDDPISWLATRAMEHDATDTLKQPLLVEVEQVDCLSAAVMVGFLPDGTSPITTAYPTGWSSILLGGGTYDPASGVDRTRLSTRNRARFRQAVVQVATKSTAGGLRVRAVKNSAFLDVPQLDAAL